MATTRPIITFFLPVKSSEIKNETVNGEEAEAEAMEFENGKLFCAFIPHLTYLLRVLLRIGPQ